MNFNDAQIKAINKVDGNVAVIATAGSGKTAVVVNRINRLVTECDVSPNNILAVTFSKKAKENIQKRLPDECEDVNVETFHSLALKIIQKCYSVGVYRCAYELWLKQWEKENALFEICKAQRVCFDKELLPYNELIRFFSIQKANMRNANNLMPVAGQPYDDNIMKTIYIQYEKYKQKHKYMEFDDLLNMACDIFTSDEKVLKVYQKSFKYILVDEYQDVSLNQATLLKYLSGDNNNLFVVGDGCQAIYKFRGGISKYLLDFADDWDGADVINLNTNYRCSKNIVDAANELAKSLPESENKYYVEPVANRGAISKPMFMKFVTPQQEASVIAMKIKRLLDDGYKYSDIAVLTRTNAQLQYFESGFFANKVPYHVVNDSSFIDKPEIKLIVSYIRLANNHSDNESFEYIYNKPNRWLSKDFINQLTYAAKSKHCSLYDAMPFVAKNNWKFKNGIDSLTRVVNQMRKTSNANIGESVKLLRNLLPIDDFVKKGKISDDGSDTEQIENVMTFQSLCAEFKTYDEFESCLNNIGRQASQADDDNKVKLMTIHKSKGLEFPVVFVAGCSDGLLPHCNSDDADDEKRLMYVAITRAMDKLYLTSIDTYNGRNMDISPFIDLLGDTIQK